MFTSTTSVRSSVIGKVAAALMGIMLLGSIPASARADAPQASIDRAHNILKQTATGKNILGLLHFGATYKDHNYIKTLAVTNRPDDFALVYRFNWEDDGVTDLAVLCDRGGHPYEVQVLYSNAQLNQPFKLAEATIQVVGNAILQAAGKNVSDSDQAAIRKAINNADAKALLEAYLQIRLF